MLSVSNVIRCFFAHDTIGFLLLPPQQYPTRVGFSWVLFEQDGHQGFFWQEPSEKAEAEAPKEASKRSGRELLLGCLLHFTSLMVLSFAYLLE